MTQFRSLYYILPIQQSKQNIGSIFSCSKPRSHHLADSEKFQNYNKINKQIMSQLQEPQGLKFKSPKKAPLRKFNLLENECLRKKPLKSASKHKLFSDKSLPKSNMSRQKGQVHPHPRACQSKNGASQGSSRKFNKSLKRQPCSETYSFSSETELPLATRDQSTTPEAIINKTKSMFDVQLQFKKDRKLSDNIHDVLSMYQQLKATHDLEEKRMLGELNEKELYRLRKIYATEEAKCMFRVLNKPSH